RVREDVPDVEGAAHRWRRCVDRVDRAARRAVEAVDAVGVPALGPARLDALESGLIGQASGHAAKRICAERRRRSGGGAERDHGNLAVGSPLRVDVVTGVEGGGDLPETLALGALRDPRAVLAG